MEPSFENPRLFATFIHEKYQITDHDLDLKVDDFKKKVCGHYWNKDVNGDLYMKVEGEKTLGDVGFKAKESCKLAWITDGRRPSLNYATAAETNVTRCGLVNVYTEDEKVHFQVLSSSTIADIESLLKNRCVDGLLEELLDRDGRSIWTRKASELKTEVQSLLNGRDIDHIVARMNDKSKLWRHLNFRIHQDLVNLTVRLSDPMNDVANILLGQGHGEIENIFISDNHSIYRHDDDRSSASRWRTIEEIGITSEDELRVEIRGDSPQMTDSTDDDDSGDVEGTSSRNAQAHLHLVIGDRRMKVPFEPAAQLHSVLTSFDENFDKKEADGEIVDVRIKSKSLYKVTGVKGAIRNCNKSFKEFNLHKGDTVEVTYQSTGRACNSYRGKLVLLDYVAPEDLDFFTVDKGDENYDVKSKLLARLNSQFPNDFCFLFEYKQQVCPHRGECHLYRPLYDKDRPPRLDKPSTTGNEDIQKEEHKHCFHLWADCEYINVEHINGFHGDVIWPWGQAEYKYWMYGIRMTSGRGADFKNHYFIFTIDGKLVDVQDPEGKPITLRSLKNCVSYREIQIDRAERNLSRFVGFVKEKSRLSLHIPKGSVLKIFERVNQKHCSQSDQSARRIWENIRNSGGYWIDCTHDEAEGLTNHWRKPE